MAASHSWKPFLTAQDVLRPRQDAGTLVFGPGGQAAIVPANIEQPTQHEPTVTSQMSSSEAPKQSSQPTSDSSTQSSSLAASSTLTQSISTSALSVAVTSSLLLPTSSSSPPPIPLSVPSSSSASTSAPLSVATSTGTFNDATDSSNHSVPFYVGVVLGTIVIFSCLTTLVAWWIRVRSRSKRRRAFANTFLPWGTPPGNDDGLEEGQDPAFYAHKHIYGDGGIHSWEPAGDRDVGEPRRSFTVLRSPASPTKRAFVPPFAHSPYVPGSFPITQSDASLPHLPDSLAYPLPLPHQSQSPCPASRPFPTHHESSESDIPSSAHSLGPLQVTNLAPGDVTSSRPGTALGIITNQDEFGTPREPATGFRPRFLGLEGNGLNVPWAPHSKPSSMDVIDVHHPPKAITTQRSQSSLRSSSTHSRATGDFWREGWTNSLRQNLVNAVNHVKSNLTSAHQTEEDHFTRAPRRVTQRQSPARAGWSERVSQQPLQREPTTSSTSSYTSKAWTLEETATGIGVVHFRGLESYTGSDGAWPHHINQEPHNASLLTYHSPITSPPPAPLHITKKPQAAVLMPSSRNPQYKHPRTAPSRASSVYSTASTTPSYYSKDTIAPPQAPRLASVPSFTGRSNARLRRDRVNRSASTARPTYMSRGSSSGYSGSSLGTDSSRLRRVSEDARNETAHE